MSSPDYNRAHIFFFFGLRIGFCSALPRARYGISMRQSSPVKHLHFLSFVGLIARFVLSVILSVFFLMVLTILLLIIILLARVFFFRCFLLVCLGLLSRFLFVRLVGVSFVAMTVVGLCGPLLPQPTCSRDSNNGRTNYPVQATLMTFDVMTGNPD